MEIRIAIINILQAINNEYGTNEFLNRLHKLLGIDLIILKDKKLTITFTNNSITIIESKTNPIYEITMCEEYHTLTKTFVGYKTIHSYDDTNNLFRRTAIFKTNSGEYLSLDEFDDERFKSRRIIKTSTDDKELINGNFEKEQLVYYKPTITQEFNHFNNSISKVINLPNNLAVYHRRQLSKIPSKSLDYVESATSINTPTLVFIGRRISKNELLIPSLKTPAPNIYIIGRETVEEKEHNYQIQIIKRDKFLIYRIADEKITENRLFSDSSSHLTMRDLKILISYTEKYISKPYTNRIIEELTNILVQLEILYNKRTKDIDFFDLKFGMIDSFDQLAFDIYLNLEQYVSEVDKLINENQTPPILKKK